MLGLALAFVSVHFSLKIVRAYVYYLVLSYSIQIYYYADAYLLAMGNAGSMLTTLQINAFQHAQHCQTLLQTTQHILALILVQLLLQWDITVQILVRSVLGLAISPDNANSNALII
jgi:hypothetical protein